LPRILSIDYGKKRCGIAVTDPLQIIATGLCTVTAKELITYLKKYFETEEVELVLIGMPKNLKNEDTDATQLVEKFIIEFKKKFPLKEIKTLDERYTSKMAQQSMLASGLKKHDRQNKALVDEISATIMLQGYMETVN
jgi:putative Holliday junction resolvase